MAIIPTSSNTTNIANLPQSQLAVGSDLLILQTSNGTQVITFDNFNAVKTDVYGNATVTGNLTAYGNTILGSVNTVSITASNYSTSYGSGITLAKDYYDNFTIQNGIILSANLTSSDYINNPLYVAVSGSLVSLSATTTGLTNTLYSQLTTVSASQYTTSYNLSTNLYSTILALSSPAGFNSVLSAGNNISLVNSNNQLTVNAVGPGVAKAWGVFGFTTTPAVGTSVPLSGSYNVTSVTYLGTGAYTVNIPAGILNGPYAISLVSSSAAGGNNPSLSAAQPSLAPPANYTPTSFTITNGAGSSKADPGFLSFIVYSF
jgi:hypothetical protein